MQRMGSHFFVGEFFYLRARPEQAFIKASSGQGGRLDKLWAMKQYEYDE